MPGFNFRQRCVLGRRELEERVINLKGVGEKTAKLFEKCGIYTCGELIRYYPRTYDTYGPVINACDAKVGEVCALKLTIIGSITKRRVRNLSIIAFEAADQTAKVKMTYFNAPYLASVLKSGTTHVFRGTVQKKGSFLSIDQPKMYKLEEYMALSGKMQPRYPLVKGLSNNTVIKAMHEAFKNACGFDEYVPGDILKRLGLMDYSKAVIGIHFPNNEKELENARRRLAYDEFLLFVLKLRLLKKFQEVIILDS